MISLETTRQGHPQAGKGERERERERERDRDRETERQRDRDRQRETQTETQTERDKDTERKRQRQRECLTIFHERTRQGKHQPDKHWNSFKGNNGKLLRDQGQVHMGFSERIDTILN